VRSLGEGSWASSGGRGGEGMGGRNSAAATPVLLNVYDLTAANDYLYWLGFGVFHSGIEGFHGDLSPLPFPFISV